MENLHISWWNLENLFDVENSPNRSDKLQRVLKNELRGWTQDVLDKKLNNLADIINKINDNSGPDLFGICEVENRNVIDLLKSRLNKNTYNIIHFDSKDGRGIDVAFIYDTEKLSVSQGDIFSHFIMKRTATRDILQVNFVIKENNKTLVAIGNHWPSRRGGELESEPYRMMAGETLSYFHERICEKLGDDVGIIAMGDFNDTPYNSSLMNYALSVNSLDIINNAKTKKYFYNLMWPFLKDGDGTHYYDKFEVLDQFMISKGIINEKSSFKIIPDSCKIEKFNKNPKNNAPIRFGRPSAKEGCNPNGYSDHFPISVKLSIS